MSYLCLTIWMVYLILLAGDVELNPGPASVDSGLISNDLSDSSIIDLSIFEQKFSIFHYNIQVWSANLITYKWNYHILT